VKLTVSRRPGGRDYVVWGPQDRAIDYFALRAGEHPRVPAPAADGSFRSEVFPGLWLAPAALIAGDLAAVFQIVQQGAATPEHRDFLARLQPRA
jgi:hypothetical protein